MQFLYVYLLSVPIFMAIDLVWLGFVAKGLYQSQLGYLMGPVNWYAAVAFYLIFLLGLTFFATFPAFTGGSLWYALILGSLFGFFTYMTYDLTNLATLRDWPLLITFVDLAWGTFLGGAVASLTYLIARALF